MKHINIIKIHIKRTKEELQKTKQNRKSKSIANNVKAANWVYSSRESKKTVHFDELIRMPVRFGDRLAINLDELFPPPQKCSPPPQRSKQSLAGC